MTKLTVREQLERWVLEEEIGDGTYRKVPLLDYVERYIDDQRADLMKRLEGRITALDWTHTDPPWGDDITLDGLLATIREEVER